MYPNIVHAAALLPKYDDWIAALCWKRILYNSKPVSLCLKLFLAQLMRCICNFLGNQYFQYQYPTITVFRYLRRQLHSHLRTCTHTHKDVTHALCYIQQRNGWKVSQLFTEIGRGRRWKDGWIEKHRRNWHWINFGCSGFRMGIYLITCTHVHLLPVHMDTICDIWGLLFDRHQKVQRTPIESCHEHDTLTLHCFYALSLYDHFFPEYNEQDIYYPIDRGMESKSNISMCVQSKIIF